MTSQPQPGPSTQGTAVRASPPASVEGPAYRATLQKCVALMDWWLVRGKDGKIRVAGYTETKTERGRAAREFRSDSITKQHADGYTLETADDKILLLRGPLNKPQMRSNRFPDEVSERFTLGFPVKWEKDANLSISDIKQMNGTTQSPLKSTEYYIEKFLHGSFINSEKYNFTEVDFKSSKGPTGNTDGPGQGLSDLSNGTPRIQEPSCNSGHYDNSVSKINSGGLCDGRMGMPDESCEDHVSAETCTGNTDEFPVRGVSSLANGIPRNQEPSGNSDDYRNSVSSATASEGLCNGRMGMPDESFEDPGPGETSQAAKPHELEVIAKGLSLAFGVIPCSKENTGRTLRSGKVCGMSNGASFKKGHSKRKTVQQETLNAKGDSAAQTTATDKLQSKDSGDKGRGRGRPRKRVKT